MEPSPPIFNCGYQEYISGDFEKAIQLCTASIEKNPKATYSYYQRSIIYSTLGKNKAATDDINKAIELNPDFWEAYAQRAALVYGTQSAVADYTKAISLNPEYGELYYDRAVVKDILGDYRGAILDYTKAIELNYEHFTSVYLSRGLVKHMLGDYRGAIKDFDRAIMDNPKDSIAYTAKGRSRISLGSFQEAVNECSKAINIDSKGVDGMSYACRGIALINNGQKDEGCLDLSKAGELGYFDSYRMIKKYCN